jgi:hypothetical protein
MGSGCALLVALASCAAVGQERMDVRTAFLDRDEDGSSQSEMKPPSPPQTPGFIENGSYRPNNQAAESIPTPGSMSDAASDGQPYYAEYSYPDRGWRRWPVIGGIYRHYVTTTKPHLQASHWGYPEYFDERPFGTDVLQAEQMQIVNGLEDQQVLYNYDFCQGDRSATLTPRGEYQLRKIVQRMATVSAPIIIQTSIDDPKLDEARRQHVMATLQTAGLPVVPEMVVVDYPPLPGLQGVEGVLIYQNLLGQTQQRGGGFSLGGGDGGGGAPVNIGNVSFGQPSQ